MSSILTLQTVILFVMPTGTTVTPSLLRAANTTFYIHSVLANKLSFALKVTGKVTDSDTVLVFCKNLILFFTTTFVNNFRNCIIEIVNVYALFWSKTNLMKINLYIRAQGYRQGY
jgi:hypothetical protein